MTRRRRKRTNDGDNRRRERERRESSIYGFITGIYEWNEIKFRNIDNKIEITNIKKGKRKGERKKRE